MVDTGGVLIRENFREYLDQLLHEGYSVQHDAHGSDPDLIDPGGNPVETWQEEYPYQDRLDRDIYETEKYALQIELLKRHRAGSTDERVKRGIHITINGIAAGLRNSG